MATDWAADVKKYAANADDAIIAGVVRYCGIALTKVDSSLVAFSDPKELDRVRNNFLKKKLGRTEADSVLDAAIAKVGDAMKADRTKNRVTVYYLLADHFKALGLFAPKAKAAPAKAAPAKAATKDSGKAKVAGVAAAAALGAAATAKKPAAKKAAPAAKAPAKAPAKAATPAAKPATKAAAPAKKAPAKKAAPAAKLTTAKAAAGGAAAVGVMGLASSTPSASTAPTSVTSDAKSVVASAADSVAKAADTAADTVSTAGAAVAGAAVAGAAGAAALASGTINKASAAVSGGAQALSGAANDEDSGLGWLWWLLGLALLLFLAWWLFLRGPADDAATAASSNADSTAAGPVDASGAAGSADLAAAPAEGSVAIPAGAGVTTELRDGKPVAKVYFDTGKTDVVPAFDATAGGLKQWLADNPGSSLAISGYADPSGNAALNADLAKKRAQAVQASLVKAGIPETSATLVKPDSVTDSTVAKDAARRVEVVVK